MIYKTTGHLNFAQGEMAMFSTFVVYVLVIEQGFNVWAAIVIVVLGRWWWVPGSNASSSSRSRTQRPGSRDPDARPVLHPQRRCGNDLGTQPHSPIPAPFPGKLDDKVDIITDRVRTSSSRTRRSECGSP
jgi:hypothetical protein